MAGKVIFDLKKGNDKGEFSIYLVYRYDTKKLVYSTGEKVKATNWNEKKRRLNFSRSAPENKDINEFLDRLENATISIFHQYRNTLKELNNEIFKIELDERVKGKKIDKDAMTLFKFIPLWIEERKSTVGQGTLKPYSTVFNHLKAYSISIKKELDFNDINSVFANDFKKFLFSLPNPHNINNVAKNFEYIRAILNEAHERGHHTNLEYVKKNFKSTKEYLSDEIYFNESELAMIFNYDFSHSKRLDKARNFFLTSCYTGLRFSDYKDLNTSHFIYIQQGSDKIEVIKKVTKKTSISVTIPVLPELKALIKRCDGIPKGISSDKVSKYMKEICEIIGFDEDIMIKDSKGGIIKEVAMKKYQMVSTHTGRRSFCTNLYIRNIPIHDIMLMSGHKTEREFLKYIRITNDENAIKVAKDYK